VIRDLGVTVLPLTSSDEPFDNTTGSGHSGHRRDIRTRQQADRVQQRRPDVRPVSNAAIAGYGQPGTIKCWSLPRP
jgi:hypothetical protein